MGLDRRLLFSLGSHWHAIGSANIVSDQRIVVIGGSAGALDALRQIVRRLPANFAAPVFVVIHIPPHAPSLLAHILEREGPLPAKQAVDGETFQNGVIYVAAPDRHL